MLTHASPAPPPLCRPLCCFALALLRIYLFETSIRAVHIAAITNAGSAPGRVIHSHIVAFTRRVCTGIGESLHLMLHQSLVRTATGSSFRL
jgi:hypothetical protein